jgi:hypothetical protein
MTDRRRRLLLIAALAVGIGLAGAPLVFGMFSRAPQGGTMIDDFRPYMTTAKIDSFRGYLDEIAAADAAASTARQDLVAQGAISAAADSTTFKMVTDLHTQWPAIRTDMTDLLDRMDANLGNFAAVDALPPFSLFPWFFVLPGLAVAVVAAGALWATRRSHPPRWPLWALGGLGLAIILAPVAFQMFSRAPQGGDMIDDFRPMMTRQRVQNVQRYFVTLGAAEGQLRLGVLPLIDASQPTDPGRAAIAQFSGDWPTIVQDFNPMIATMSDNVDNFQAVDALPPFALFPWFFVLPGAIVLVLAGAAIRLTPSNEAVRRPSP